MDKRRDIVTLMQKLGYTFNDTKLLDTALTHRSFHAVNNERLEFLGDSILSFIITKSLYLKYPNLSEGKLTRLRSSLVKKETLYQVASELNIGNFLLLGIGEKRSGGFERKSTLADALEAIIGAIFLDSDIVNCSAVVEKWFYNRLEVVVEQSDDKDPKTMLQEKLQAMQKPLPSYVLESITGSAHEQIFNIICQAVDFETKGVGKSRREAEQSAAKSALKLLDKK